MVLVVDDTKENIILLDIMMPVMDGYAASRLIRETTDSMKLPIIALSADVMEGIAERVQEAGMQAHLAKPINQAILLTFLLHWIRPIERISNIADQPAIPPGTNHEMLQESLKSFAVSEGIERMSGKYGCQRGIQKRQDG